MWHKGWVVPQGVVKEVEKMEQTYPPCLKCSKGVLVPLSDYGREGASIMYKAWVCTNPECGFHIRIDNGEISTGESIGPSTKGR